MSNAHHPLGPMIKSGIWHPRQTERMKKERALHIGLFPEILGSFLEPDSFLRAVDKQGLEREQKERK